MQELLFGTQEAWHQKIEEGPQLQHVILLDENYKLIKWSR